MTEKQTKQQISLNKTTILIGLAFCLSLLLAGYLFGSSREIGLTETQIQEIITLEYSQNTEQIEAFIEAEVANQLEIQNAEDDTSGEQNSREQISLLEEELTNLNAKLAEQSSALAELAEQVKRQEIVPIVQVPDHIEVVSTELITGETGQIAIVEVEANDTVWSIARRFQTPVTADFVNQIIQHNQITPSTLQVGTKIMVPLLIEK